MLAAVFLIIELGDIVEQTGRHDDLNVCTFGFGNLFSVLHDAQSVFPTIVMPEGRVILYVFCFDRSAARQNEFRNPSQAFVGFYVHADY
jgi:hypothetical protein